MEQVKNYKIMLGAAAGNTLAFFVLLALNYSKDKTINFSNIALLGFLVVAINLWVLGAKRYIDFAIEEKIKQMEIKE